MSISKIAIACSVNEQYALPLLVMLTSLVGRLRPDVEATVYLMHQQLRRETLDAVGAVVDVREVRLSGACLAQLPRDRTFPPEAAAPLLLPTVLPSDLERVVFLDADMLVLDDIAPLWTMPLEGRALAAVVDPAIPACRSSRGVKGWRERGIPAAAPYFNAGVLLVDLRAWRRRNVAERAIEYIRAVGDRVDYLHQEALNATVWDDWLPIAPRWNVSATAGRWFDPTAEAAVAAPAIVHFAGRMKPWRMRSGSRFAPAYAAVLSRVTGVSRPGHSWQDAWCGWYDRTLRSVCHPCERFMWSRRLL